MSQTAFRHQIESCWCFAETDILFDLIFLECTITEVQHLTSLYRHNSWYVSHTEHIIPIACLYRTGMSQSGGCGLFLVQQVNGLSRSGVTHDDGSRLWRQCLWSAHTWPCHLASLFHTCTLSPLTLSLVHIYSARIWSRLRCLTVSAHPIRNTAIPWGAEIKERALYPSGQFQNASFV